jgi:hypothetical protein
VGLVNEGRVWLGGDSAASDPRDGLTVVYTAPKVFRRGRILLGCVESFRMRDLLAHQFQAPPFRSGQTPDDYVFQTVIEAIRATFKKGGYDLEAELEDDDDIMPSGAILLGFQGRLFTIDWDYHIGEVRDHFMAIGAGAPYALGSLHVTHELQDEFGPRARVVSALKVATHYCGSVRPPFRIISGK